MLRLPTIILTIVLLTSCTHKSGRITNLNTSKSKARTQQVISNKIPANKLIKHKTSNTQTYTPSQIFDKYNTAVFMVYANDGHKGIQGSGFFISATGKAVSNYHVFNSAPKDSRFSIVSDNKQYKIKKILSYDKDYDYIVFQVNIGNSPVNYIPLADKLPKIGEKVYAIGSPQGLENTFSSGEISQIRDNHLLQISVPIDHGSSGGALINRYGQVVGITTAGLKSTANLNFAMSIEVIK